LISLFLFCFILHHQNGKLRVVASKYLFNYGALPQTWENPNHTNPELQTRGDNDLIDAVEISSEPIPTGTVKQVKILGAVALIDEGLKNFVYLSLLFHFLIYLLFDSIHVFLFHRYFVNRRNRLENIMY
jgi:hypothetical protein